MKHDSLRRLSFHTISLTLAFLLSALGAQSATPVVGKATNVRVDALQAQQSTAAATLHRLDPIFLKAMLRTTTTGALRVLFQDGSALVMGASSTVAVDEFVVATTDGSGKQVLRYVKGMFRFISGTVPKRNVRLETPTAAVGIRGTVVRTAVEDDGTTTVGVDEGEISVTSKQTGQTVILGPGEKVTIRPGGEFGPIQLGRVEGCD